MRNFILIFYINFSCDTTIHSIVQKPVDNMIYIYVFIDLVEQHTLPRM